MLSTYEFTKMAVDKNYRRLGIAETISYASFKKAKELGAKKVILYSNKKNAGAIKLYEKIGFRHVEVEQGVYKRADVKMVIDIEMAIRGLRAQKRKGVGKRNTRLRAQKRKRVKREIQG